MADKVDIISTPIVCPFDGEPLKIEELPIGLCKTPMFKAVGRFWQTKWYSSREGLIADIGMRAGRRQMPPDVTPSLVEIRERQPPPSNPAEGLGGEVDGDRVEGILKMVP